MLLVKNQLLFRPTCPHCRKETRINHRSWTW